MFLKSLYRLLDAVNKPVANNVAEGLLMDHTYEEASDMLDKMTKTNRAWHTREAEVVSNTSTWKLSK